jgi:hypothetical protein
MKQRVQHPPIVSVDVQDEKIWSFRGRCFAEQRDDVVSINCCLNDTDPIVDDRSRDAGLSGIRLDPDATPPRLCQVARAVLAAVRRAYLDEEAIRHADSLEQSLNQSILAVLRKDSLLIVGELGVSGSLLEAPLPR